jgi:acyl carrier protein
MAKFNRQEIEEKVNEIIVDKFLDDRAEVNADTKLFDDLGMDSLDAIELEMELEKQFTISIPDEESVKKEWNIGKVYDIVEKLTK